jgi:hypothetical protein
MKSGQAFWRWFLKQRVGNVLHWVSSDADAKNFHAQCVS